MTRSFLVFVRHQLVDPGARSRLVIHRPGAARHHGNQTIEALARGEEGWMIRAVSRNGGPTRVLVRFDDLTRQDTRYGFATDGQASARCLP